MLLEPLEKLLSYCLGKVTLKNPNFKESTKKSFELSLGKLQKTGIISYKMQSMVDSLRVQFFNTQNTVNNYKKPVAR